MRWNEWTVVLPSNPHSLLGEHDLEEVVITTRAGPPLGGPVASKTALGTVLATRAVGLTATALPVLGPRLTWQLDMFPPRKPLSPVAQLAPILGGDVGLGRRGSGLAVARRRSQLPANASRYLHS